MAKGVFVLFQLLLLGIVFFNFIQCFESNPGSILGKSTGKDDFSVIGQAKDRGSDENDSHPHQGDDDNDDGDMSAGTISGIGIGLIAIIGVVGVTSFMLHKRRSVLKQSEKNNNTTVGFVQNSSPGGSGASVAINIQTPSAPEESKTTIHPQIQELRVPTSDDEEEDELPPSYESVVLN